MARTDDGVHRHTDADYAGRVAQLAHALAARSVEGGDRLGAFACNHDRHDVVYFGVPGLGAPEDWLAEPRTRRWALTAPQVAFLVGFVLPVLWRATVWPAALLVIGTACVANARRCGRLHCNFSGPFFPRCGGGPRRLRVRLAGRRPRGAGRGSASASLPWHPS